MRKITVITFVFFSLLSISLRSQNVKTFDRQKCIVETNEFVKLDSLYHAYHDSLYSIGKDWVKKYNIWALKKANDVSCSNPKLHLETQKLIAKEQDEIKNYSQFLLDTFPKFKAELLNEIVDRINIVLDEYSSKNNVEVVIETLKTDDFDEKSEISSHILELYESKYSNKDSKIGWNQSVKKLENKYQLQARLNKKTTYLNIYTWN